MSKRPRSNYNVNEVLERLFDSEGIYDEELAAATTRDDLLQDESGIRDNSDIESGDESEAPFSSDNEDEEIVVHGSQDMKMFCLQKMMQLTS